MPASIIYAHSISHATTSAVAGDSRSLQLKGDDAVAVPHHLADGEVFRLRPMLNMALPKG